jgi:hypothetical protein
MATSHVISGLIAKRAALDALILAAEERLRRLRRDLAHVDGAILALIRHSGWRRYSPSGCRRTASRSNRGSWAG